MFSFVFFILADALTYYRTIKLIRPMISKDLEKVIGRVSLLLQQACVPCLAGDLEGACELIVRSSEVVEKAHLMEPEDLELWQGFARHLIYMWDLIGNWEALIKLLRIYPWESQVHSNLLHALHYLPGVNMGGLAAQHRRWARCHVASIVPCTCDDINRDPERKLRIGYVSPDFRGHCVIHFLRPLLESHDRGRFTLVGYGNVPPHCRDEITGQMQDLFDLFRDIWDQDDASVVQQIRADRIDILIDLSGHTPHHRLALFAAKPAPVQVTYLGYPGTTGLHTMDYRLTDNVLDPPGGGRHYSESLLRLDSGFACYRAPEFAPPVSDAPFERQGHITFGSFAGAAKHNPKVVSLWAEVLRRTPGSRLLLRFQGADQGVIQQQCRKAFSRCGVDAERIEFGDIRSFVEHLAQYAQIDVALDTFPWSSHTTLCEALWMGVPVVTLAGDSSASQMGASVLRSLGRPQWIASESESYVDIAVRLAQDRQGLRQLRASLRKQMSQSGVCNAVQVTRNIEACLRRVWRDRGEDRESGDRIESFPKSECPVLQSRAICWQDQGFGFGANRLLAGGSSASSTLKLSIEDALAKFFT